MFFHRPSLFSISGTDLSALSAATSLLICSGGSVNFLLCGSMLAARRRGDGGWPFAPHELHL
jgi:hypothetical protein